VPDEVFGEPLIWRKFYIKLDEYLLYRQVDKNGTRAVGAKYA